MLGFLVFCLFVLLTLLCTCATTERAGLCILAGVRCLVAPYDPCTALCILPNTWQCHSAFFSAVKSRLKPVWQMLTEPCSSRMAARHQTCPGSDGGRGVRWGLCMAQCCGVTAWHGPLVLPEELVLSGGLQLSADGPHDAWGVAFKRAVVVWYILTKHT